MDLFIRTCLAVLLGTLLCLVLGKQGKETAVLLSAAVCCMVAIVAMQFFLPILDFLHELEGIGDLDGSLISVLYKVVGIGILTEISSLICADTGNSALAKALQFLGGTAMLWLSIPVFRSLIHLIRSILEAL